MEEPPPMFAFDHTPPPEEKVDLYVQETAMGDVDLTQFSNDVFMGGEVDGVLQCSAYQWQVCPPNDCKVFAMNLNGQLEHTCVDIDYVVQA